MEEFIQVLITDYGEWAILLLLLMSGFGIAIGEDVITIPAGVLVARGELDLVPTILCGYFGVLLADLMWFFICSRYGTALLHRRWFKRAVHPRRLLEAKHQIEQRGVWVIVLARFIPGTRTTAITAAALLHMPIWRFAMATAPCIVCTLSLQLGVGYLIGRQVLDKESAGLIPTMVAVVVGVIAVLIIVTWWRASRKQIGRRPRAKAKWLRRFRRR